MQGSLVPRQRQIDNLHFSREVDINVLLDFHRAKGKAFVGRDIFWERRVGPYIAIILPAKEFIARGIWNLGCYMSIADFCRRMGFVPGLKN
jgi:hypothetical protein